MQNDNALPWQIALTMVPGLGCVGARALLDHFGSATAVFRAAPEEMLRLTQMTPGKASAIKKFDNFRAVDKVLTFTRRYDIQVLTMDNPDYPARLREVHDPPTLLYYMGNADLNHPGSLSVVGTRTPTSYGKQTVRTLLNDLAAYNLLVVSGLADGIDALAHRHALDNGLSTIAVLGHGLDMIYPAGNRALAKNMLENGGLVTEFPPGTGAAAAHFPMRNRIIAGISQGTVVIETDMKGGSMVTAGIAFSYDLPVFAFPGRITDAKSKGCNALLLQQKASLPPEAGELAAQLKWTRNPARGQTPPDRASIPPADVAQKVIYDILVERDFVHIDELHSRCNLSPSEISTALFLLELSLVVESLPGSRYRLRP
jgi:DNA processing protein